ncbi:cell division control protein 3, putative [Listeria monocytogenes str. 4b H7858]|nr:cell division control protein 3, putative [Listeria monocytogenes str. 4b H7858] [Listeria monocytogenes serotype 4b str. H7858]
MKQQKIQLKKNQKNSRMILLDKKQRKIMRRLKVKIIKHKARLATMQMEMQITIQREVMEQAEVILVQTALSPVVRRINQMKAMLIKRMKLLKS